MVKNAVIVPVGAKGGFVVKSCPTRLDREASGRGDRLLPDVHLRPARHHRQPGRGGGRAAAATWSRATTATTPTSWSPPTKAPRRSATSPTSIADDYGFWLGDAFASGGSVGYDHKAMGITARGAWESVKCHFREMASTRRQQDFTVVGIGDMSGDVFGNGMLLSEHIQLVAAFDHRHIFLDPDPDAGGVLRRAAADVRPAPLVLGRLRRGADLARAAASARAPRSRSRSRRRCARRSACRRRRHGADPDRADPRDPARAGRPALERRHRHLREGRRPSRTPTRATRPTTRCGSTAPSCAPGRRRGRQPRPHPARPDRVRAGGRADQHRRHRQLGRRRHLRP